jgi:hypothetical protein
MAFSVGSEVGRRKTRCIIAEHQSLVSLGCFPVQNPDLLGLIGGVLHERGKIYTRDWKTRQQNLAKKKKKKRRNDRKWP